MPKPVYAYWDLRGLGEPCRYLMHYAGVEFEDKRYDRESGQWLKDKFNLGLDFPNLPYYIDGNVKLTQSTAILRYLAKKHGLEGDSEEQKIRVSVAEQQLFDFRQTFFMLCYNKDFDKVKGDVVKNLPDQMKLYANFLGNRKFMAGDSVTYIDFLAMDTFDFYKYIAPGYLNQFPSLKKYQERMESLPELQKYLKSSTYTRWPVVSPLGVFAGKGPEPARE